MATFEGFLANMAATPPDIFVCPISRDVMHDPVVLIETGQIYDRESINGWFERGCFTCPMTGKYHGHRICDLILEFL